MLQVAKSGIPAGAAGQYSRFGAGEPPCLSRVSKPRTRQILRVRRTARPARSAGQGCVVALQAQVSLATRPPGAFHFGFCHSGRQDQFAGPEWRSPGRDFA